MVISELIMPKLGLSMTTGEVVEWTKQEGDPVKTGEVCAKIITKKLEGDVEARGDGTLLKIIVPVGGEAPYGAVIGFVGDPGDEIPEVTMPVIEEEVAEVAEGVPGVPGIPGVPEVVLASPAAKRRAREEEIEIALVRGTGPGGRITEGDVEIFIEEVLEIKPYSGMRRVIGDHMSASRLAAADVVVFTEVDLSDLMRFRKEILPSIQKMEEQRIPFTALFAKAVAIALERHPIVNSTLFGDQIIIKKAVHLGIAVALDEGLIVPVVRNAQKKSLVEIGYEIIDLAKRGRAGQLALEEMSGSTFSITNLSMYPIDGFTPVINQPENAILGMGRTVEKPVVVDGEIVIRPIMTLSLTFDHRVIDGLPAAEFLKTLKRLLENYISMVGRYRGMPVVTSDTMVHPYE